MRVILILSGFLFFVSSCCNNVQDNKKLWKEEIIKTEAEFCNTAEKQGLQKAFLKFSSKDAVLLRDNKLVKGKNAIADFYKNYDAVKENIKLIWEPDFVDVSSSGDMAYTYGKYIFTSSDSSGKIVSDTGIFHTVWKRQENGEWRFVWD